MDTGKVRDIKSPTYRFDATPQGKFMLSIAFGQSKYYVDSLSENLGTIEYRRKQGTFKNMRPGKRPSGTRLTIRRQKSQDH